MHVVMHYEALTPDDRRYIWERLFQELESERPRTIKIKLSAKEYVFDSTEMKGLEWNAREIQNGEYLRHHWCVILESLPLTRVRVTAFQTAVALADYRFIQLGTMRSSSYYGMSTLDSDDFKQVCKMTQDFKSYLMAVHGPQERIVRDYSSDE